MTPTTNCGDDDDGGGGGVAAADDDEILSWLSVVVHCDLVRLELTRDLVYR